MNRSDAVDSGPPARPHLAVRRITVAGCVALWALFAVTHPAGARTSGVTIAITDRVDRPVVQIAPGTTVTWRNDDAERHRIRSRQGPVQFDSGNLDPGATFGVALAVEGVYPYLDERNKDAAAYGGVVIVTNGGDRPASPAQDGDAVPTEPDAGAAAATASVSILDESFAPASVSVTAGASVTWTNTSDRDHTVSFRDGTDGSDVLGGAATFTHTFPVAGTVPYFCAIHPEMTGTVTVVTATDGGRADASATDGTASGPPTPRATPSPAVHPLPAQTVSPVPAAAVQDQAAPDADAPVSRWMALAAALVAGSGALWFMRRRMRWPRARRQAL